MTKSVAVIGAGPGGLVAGALAAGAGLRADDLRAGPDAGWTVDRAGRHQRRLADDAHQHQPDPRRRSATSSTTATSCYPSNRDVLDYLHRYAETFGLTSRIRFGTRVERAEPRRNRLARQPFRHDEAFERVVVASGRFQCARDPGRSGARHLRRLSGCDLDLPLPRTGSIPRQARSRRRLRDQRARDRLGTRATRRGTRRGDAAATAIRAAEVRRRRAVRSPDLHAIRHPGQRNAAASRGRPAAQGDRRRGRRQPGAVRRAGAGPVALRRRRHPQPGIPAAGRGGPNHGASVDDIDHGNRP